MRIQGDMRGFHAIPHFVPGVLVGEGGVIQGCNFSWTLLWRFKLDPALWGWHNASMMELLETVYSGDFACLCTAFGGGGGGQQGPGSLAIVPGTIWSLMYEATRSSEGTNQRQCLGLVGQ
jgi:hypothetical protein